jgi:histidinol phosphatase-like enzyme
VLGLAWRPEVGDDEAAAAQVEAGFAHMRDRLGVAIEVRYCPHGAGPPICWCRKPLPGLGVLLVERHRLDPARCVYVGQDASDEAFARTMGFIYRHRDEHF